MKKQISGERKAAYSIGMLKDALDEADVKVGGAPEKVVMIRCRECGKKI